ncbi:12685_t:CDS:1, partial [Ambispora leptoticha]
IASKDKTKVQHISKIRSAIQKAKKITPENFKKSAKKLFKFKNEYSAQFLQMATEISNLGQISLKSTVVCTKKFYEFITGEEPEKWINIHTLSRWNKEVAALQLDSNKPKSYNISNYGYGLLVDESKRGERKILIVATSFWNIETNYPMFSILGVDDLIHCNSNTVATSVTKICNNNNIDFKRCIFWLTDNTSYMSSNKNGAVVKFNTLNQSTSFRIPCALHATQIALMNFENNAFGKIDGPKGSYKEHPFNLINLAFKIHDGH